MGTCQQDSHICATRSGAKIGAKHVQTVSKASTPRQLKSTSIARLSRSFGKEHQRAQVVNPVMLSSHP